MFQDQSVSRRQRIEELVKKMAGGLLVCNYQRHDRETQGTLGTTWSFPFEFHPKKSFAQSTVEP